MASDLPTVAGPSGGGRQRHFTVRCEGRWRVRSAPSLNSKVLGSISNNTVVIGEDELPPGPPRTRLRPEGDGMLDAAALAAAESLSCLWVRVVRLESKEPGGVSEMKRDIASGGAMFCLRRNALGYGLYETGIESLEGPLLLLPEDLASDLRGDAQRANVERNEDVSLTWKILDAADSFSRLLRGSPEHDKISGAGTHEFMQPMRKRPEDVFEANKRQQLKKSAGTLAYVTNKLIGAMGPRLQPEDDHTAILAKDVRGRYARIRAALSACVNAMPGSNESEPTTARVQAISNEGSQRELQLFVENCTRVENSGGWPELSHEVRQEIISFAQLHYTDLQPSTAAINRFVSSTPTSPSSAGAANSPTRAASNGGAANTPDATAAAQQESLISLGESPPPSTAPLVGAAAVAKPAAASKGVGGFCPLLPPPPPPKNAVSLI